MKHLFAAWVVMSLTMAWAHGADIRGDFLKLIERPRVPLAAQVELQSTTDGLTQYRFSFAADAQDRVIGILLKSVNSTGRRPVVIALHGTGGDKASQLPFLRDLASKGFIAVAIDARYHGERSKSGKGLADYQDAIVRAYRGETQEHPFFIDSVWDVMRLIDYLQTRDDIDAGRIGLFGISKGGIETYLTAAVDPRVAVAVPCISVESFRWALDNDKWQPRIGTIPDAFDSIAKLEKIEKPDAAFIRKIYDRIAPGIYTEFDGPSMLPLIAPRPLMTINGDSDDRTPLPGLKECTDAALKAYREAGAEDHFIVRIQEKTGHAVNPDSKAQAVEWFAKWLKP